MTEPRVEGVCPVVATPFTAEGAVDYESFRRTLRHLIGAGVRSVMFPGFASEFYKLTDAERDSLVTVLIDETRDAPAPVTAVISIPDHATSVAVDRARRAVEAGADLVNLLPPSAHGPSSAQVRQHLHAVLTAIAPTPAILQYAPAQTGVTLDPSTIAAIAEADPNLVQVKVESTPPGQLISALRAAAPLMTCVVGYAGLQLIDGLRRGAVGVQPGSSFPELYLLIWEGWSDGDLEAAEQLHTRLLPYLSYWMQSVELIIAAEKEISYRRGIISTPVCRAPFRELDAEESRMIDRFFEEFGEHLPILG
ncbi:dihydrodipicolinate synthase family protein [soil metagenome]